MKLSNLICIIFTSIIEWKQMYIFTIININHVTKNDHVFLLNELLYDVEDTVKFSQLLHNSMKKGTSQIRECLWKCRKKLLWKQNTTKRIINWLRQSPPYIYEGFHFKFLYQHVLFYFPLGFSSFFEFFAN